MSTPPTTPRPEPTPERRLLRRRTADRAAARLHEAMSEGLTRRVTARYLDYRVTRCWEYPFLRRVLHQAPPIAASGDPAAVRVSRTPRGNLCVIRLHGPDWSLILTPGRPLPGFLLAVEDYGHLYDGQPRIWRIDPGRYQSNVAAMNLAILAALDTPAPLTQHDRKEPS
jgi:hypothetical protein